MAKAKQTEEKINEENADRLMYAEFGAGFDDEGFQATEADYYKGEKGRIDRIWIPIMGVHVAFVHFVETGNLGYIISDGEYKKNEKGIYECVRMGDIDKLVGAEASPRFGANIVVYSTKRTGELAKPFGYRVAAARWRTQHFAQIRNSHKAFAKMGGLTCIDLQVSCEDTDWQRLNFQGMPECNIRDIAEKLNEKDAGTGDKFVAEILAEVKDPGWKIEKLLGRKRTPQEVAAAMQGAVAEGTKGERTKVKTPVVADEADLDAIITGLKE